MTKSLAVYASITLLMLGLDGLWPNMLAEAFTSKAWAT
jgi:hypothetical protein